MADEVYVPYARTFAEARMMFPMFTEFLEEIGIGRSDPKSRNTSVRLLLTGAACEEADAFRQGATTLRYSVLNSAIPWSGAVVDAQWQDAPLDRVEGAAEAQASFLAWRAS